MSDGKRMDAPAALAEDRGPHPQSGSTLRISRVETFLVPPRWLFVRIETDSGVVGWGEPVVAREGAGR